MAKGPVLPEEIWNEVLAETYIPMQYQLLQRRCEERGYPTPSRAVLYQRRSQSGKSRQQNLPTLPSEAWERVLANAAPVVASFMSECALAEIDATPAQFSKLGRKLWDARGENHE
jgi:hypothetical protein